MTGSTTVMAGAVLQNRHVDLSFYEVPLGDRKRPYVSIGRAGRVGAKGYHIGGSALSDVHIVQRKPRDKYLWYQLSSYSNSFRKNKLPAGWIKQNFSIVLAERGFK
jgi:hypothetical protein